MDDQTTPLTSDDDVAIPTDSTTPEIDVAALQHYLEEVEANLAQIRRILGGQTSGRISTSAWREKAASFGSMSEDEGSRIIEGVFDGQNMVGPDGKQYSVPANYASKSKLVEGDVLKLTITRDGSFIYKQIGPVERQRLIGELTRDGSTGEYKVTANGKSYKILLASVTYFKGEAGDEVVVLVPQDGDSRWGAVENIIKKSESGEAEPVAEA